MEYRAPPAAKRRYSGVLQNELQTAVPPSHARPAPPSPRDITCMAVATSWATRAACGRPAFNACPPSFKSDARGLRPHALEVPGVCASHCQCYPLPSA